MAKLRDIVNTIETANAIPAEREVETKREFLVDPLYPALGRLQGTLEQLQEDTVGLLERLEVVSQQQIKTAEIIAEREQKLQEMWQKLQEDQRKEDQKLLIKITLIAAIVSGVLSWGATLLTLLFQK